MTTERLFNQIVADLKAKFIQAFGKRLVSFYLTGSYALGKISPERPDINLLIILGTVQPKDFLTFGQVLRENVNEFKNKVNIRPEPRPFRPILPKKRGQPEVFLRASLLDLRHKTLPTPFNLPKWVLEGMKSSYQLLYGKDLLKEVSIPKITPEDIINGALIDLAFFQLPLERAPIQYDESESDLLFNEAVLSGKMAACLGVEVAMTEAELAKRKYLKFVANKELLPLFYRERYNLKTSQWVENILNARENFNHYKNDPKKAEEIFITSLNLMNKIRGRVLGGTKQQPNRAKANGV